MNHSVTLILSFLRVLSFPFRVPFFSVPFSLRVPFFSIPFFLRVPIVASSSLSSSLPAVLLRPSTVKTPRR